MICLFNISDFIYIDLFVIKALNMTCCHSAICLLTQNINGTAIAL